MTQVIQRSRHADVVVVGAGVLGTFHAYFAARKGYKVLLLERNAWPNDASTRNFGMVVRSIVETSGEWAQYVRGTAEIYRAIQHEQDITVRNPGSLYIASTQVESRVLQEFAHLHGDDYHCRYLEAQEALRLYPFVRADYCRGALHFADDLTVEPRRLLRQLIPYVTRTSSVEYLPHTTVVSVETQGDHCVVKDASGNVFTSDTVFMCSGSEYHTLFPELFTRSGLRVCKLQMLSTVPQQEGILPHSILSGLSIGRYAAFKSCPSYSLIEQQQVDEDIRRYGIHLLFKQAADGSIIIGDSHEYYDFAETIVGEERTNPTINEVILRYARTMLDLPDWTIGELWNGYYLMHPQRQVYTETIDQKIHVTIGIAGKGMSSGAGFSRHHVDTILG
jgi:D-hydroxyproline dehydrogenase subunit beta